MTVAAEAARENGIHRDVPFDEYASWEAANASTLNTFSKTPAHVRYELDHGGKERTPSLDLGWLVHVAALEPDRFDAEFVVPPKVDKRTRVGKAEWAEFTAQHPGKGYIDKDNHAQVIAMRESLHAHETAGAFLGSRGHNELSILWEDEEHHVRCKARIDRIGNINEYPAIGDIKTTRNAGRHAVERSIQTYGYHVQAAHYLAGVEALVPTPAGNPFRRFFFFFVESEPPYCAAVYEIDDQALEEGARLRSRYLQQWRECHESGRWPGYPSGVEYAGLPAWAYKQWETWQ